MPVIAVDNVSKCFELQPDRPRSFQELVVGAFKRRPRPTKHTFWALKDVSFCVDAGETLGIIGANGSGKSTCLKLLTRIIEPTTGKISVQGRVSALLELGAGFHPELTGRENIFLSGSVLGLSRREMAERFDAIVAFAELERFIDIPVKFYSSGMYVRLAFATAINVKPDILLIDEVLAVGDQAFQEKCLDYINGLKTRNVTIVFISHSLDAVRNLCGRAIWLDNGVLRGDGVTDVIVGQYLQHIHEKEERAALANHTRGRKIPSDLIPAALATEQPACSESTTDGMARYRKRWGSREVEILDVSLHDHSGRERLLLTTGEPLTIAIHYRAHCRIEHPMFGLAIHRSDGVQINGPNNILAGMDIPFIEGEGEVHYTVDILPLLPGTYYLTAAIYDTAGHHAYDHHALSYRFRVQAGVIAERYGIVYVPARWEHIPAVETVTKEAG